MTISSSSDPQISVIVVVYNGAKFIGQCLHALYQSVGVTFEVLVVDNASADNSTDLVTREFPQVRLICSPKNLGFAGGNNLGIAASRAPLLILLNQDAMVRSDTLLALVTLFEAHADIGIAGCKIFDPDGETIQHAGGIIHPNGLTDHIGRGQKDRNQFEEIADVPYVTGAVFAIRRQLYLRLGGLDRGYVPAYYEETELCLAVARNHYRVVYCPKASAIHYEATASGIFSSRFYYNYHRNRLRFLLRNFPFTHLLTKSLPFELEWLKKHAGPDQKGPLYQAYKTNLLRLPVTLAGRFIRR